MGESSSDEPMFPDLSDLAVKDEAARAGVLASKAPLSAAALPNGASDALLGSGYCVCPNSAGR